ncbi:MAG: histidine kinase [Syntrophomonadaceae bacterium]|nr:histidine kinase [Syntrophomonadaceae bacterium]
MNRGFVRMATFFLKPGRLITIKIGKEVYQSRIEEVQKHTLYLSAPVDNDNLMPLDKNQEIRVHFQIKKDSYSFTSPILDYIEFPKPLLVVNRPKQLKKFEQRLWDRIPAVLNIVYSPVENGKPIAPPVKSKTVNISGGGVLLECSQELPPGQDLKLLLTLPWGKRIAFKGKVVRVINSIANDSPYPFRAAIKITDISFKSREQILYLIFHNHQRESIIKRLISSIDKCKYQIFDISENARKEYDRVKLEIINNSSEIIKLMNQTIEDDDKEISGKSAGQLRDRDVRKYLRQSIIELERHSEHNREMVEKAEMLTSQLGILLKFMYSELESIKEGIDRSQDNKELVWRVINAQEEERKRIARDIHDGPAQVLANIFMHLDYCCNLWNKNPEQVILEIQKLKDTARENLNDLRKIIFDLRPRSLDETGLINTLERYFNEYQEQYNINIQFRYQGLTKSLGPLVNTSIFRIIQEALNNAKKHASASKVTVILKINSSHLDLVISDNGRGFRLDKLKKDKEQSFGIGIMQERVKILSGTFNIYSQEGKGTRISVKVPLSNLTPGYYRTPHQPVC